MKNILVTLSLFILASCSSGYKKDNSQSQSQLDRPNRSISTTEDGQESIVSVPVRFNGYPIYAGMELPNNNSRSVLRAAEDACKYFGMSNVHSYSMSRNMQSVSIKFVGFYSGVNKINEGKDIAIFTKLYCSSPWPEKPLPTGDIQKSRKVPLQVDGIPIYAGEVGESNLPPRSSIQIARRACEYFGFKDVFSYETDWSAEDSERVVILSATHDEDSTPVKFQVGGKGTPLSRPIAVFKNLLCSI